MFVPYVRLIEYRPLSDVQALEPIARAEARVGEYVWVVDPATAREQDWVLGAVLGAKGEHLIVQLRAHRFGRLRTWAVRPCELTTERLPTTVLREPEPPAVVWGPGTCDTCQQQVSSPLAKRRARALGDVTYVAEHVGCGGGVYRHAQLLRTLRGE